MFPPRETDFSTARDRGWEMIRGHSEFVRLARSPAGFWWWLDAEERPFFGKGVGGIQPVAGESPKKLAMTVAENFLRWEANTIGPGSGRGLRPRGAWEMVDVPFGSAFLDTTIRAGGLSVPDVFDPRWLDCCRTVAAEYCGPRRFDRQVLAYRGAAGVRWEPTAPPASQPPRPQLLQVCLALEPSYAAYHAAWEFVLAAHSGDWDRLMRDWDITWPNRADLRQKTLEEVAVTTPGFQRDQENFLREFSRRYFLSTTESIRGADPHHLVFAASLRAGAADSLAPALTAAGVDGITLEILAPADLQEIASASGDGRVPVFVSDFNWSVPSFRTAPARGRAGRTAIESMLANGRKAATRLIEDPTVVGYAWSHWRDEENDAAPYGHGLLRPDGRDAPEHAELFGEINRGAENKRRRRERLLAARLAV